MRVTLALLVVAALSAQGRWTFCVAESGRQIWITEVFAASQARETLEAHFAAELSARGVNHPVAQCPAPRDDKTDAVNARFTATEFHRRLGDVLHPVAPPR
jgi:hypothetical protein